MLDHEWGKRNWNRLIVSVVSECPDILCYWHHGARTQITNTGNACYPVPVSIVLVIEGDALDQISLHVIDFEVRHIKRAPCLVVLNLFLKMAVMIYRIGSYRRFFREFHPYRRAASAGRVSPQIDQVRLVQPKGDDRFVPGIVIGLFYQVSILVITG